MITDPTTAAKIRENGYMEKTKWFYSFSREKNCENVKIKEI